MSYNWAHLLIHFILLVASLAMWWNIVTPVPEWNHSSDLKKMGFIFANGALLTPACALIIFSDHPMYTVFSLDSIGARSVLLEHTVRSLWEATWLNPLQDQRFGGIIMKLVQEIMYGVSLFFVFLHWYRKENPVDGRIDPIPDEGSSEMQWNGTTNLNRV